MKIKRYSGNPAPGLPDTTNIADPQLRLFLDRIKVAITAVGEINVGALGTALLKDAGFRKQLDKVISVTAGKIAREKAGELLDEQKKNLPGKKRDDTVYEITAIYAWSDGNTTVYTESSAPRNNKASFCRDTGTCRPLPHSYRRSRRVRPAQDRTYRDRRRFPRDT